MYLHMCTDVYFQGSYLNSNILFIPILSNYLILVFRVEAKLNLWTCPKSYLIKETGLVNGLVWEKKN